MMTPEDAREICAGNHRNPFSVLGMHLVEGKMVIRAFQPEADAIEVLDAKSGRKVCDMILTDGVFEGSAARRKKPFAYRLRLAKGEHVWEAEDPYCFGPVLGELDEHLIGEGAHLRLWDVLGAHVMKHEGCLLYTSPSPRDRG